MNLQLVSVLSSSGILLFNESLKKLLLIFIFGDQGGNELRPFLLHTLRKQAPFGVYVNVQKQNG